MPKIVSSDIVVAYSRCPRKAFLLLFTEEQGVTVEYVDILNQQKTFQKNKHIESINLATPVIQIDNIDSTKQHGGSVVDAHLKSGCFEASCDVLTRVSKVSSSKKSGYEPTIFIGAHNINKENKLELVFAGYILEKIQGQLPEQGIIITVGGESQRLNLKPLLRSLHKIISPLQDWLMFPPNQPPPVILNRHCPYCQFQRLCRLQAEQTDNLSLLSGMTPKAIQRYEKKGIFTVKQLSYLFKPRRLKKQARSHHKTHKPELQALAIRTGKIYIQEMPSISRQNVDLFIDFEGIPDQHLYYLIGLLVCEEDKNTYHPFWANVASDEVQIWQNFIDKLTEYPAAPIYHYGNYELRARDTLSKRYESDIEGIKSRLVNINSQIYSKVYFPVHSNGLKEIGRFIGANWALPDSSGLQSLVWRHRWEVAFDPQYKNYLLTYNRDDCLALRLLTDKLSKIKETASTLSEVDFISTPKRNATESGKQIHDQFETILKFAHANYDEKKIKFRQQASNDEKTEDKPKYGHKQGYHGQRKVKPKATKTIQVSSAGQVCPKDGMSLRPTEQTSKRLIIDLVLTKSGVKKTTIVPVMEAVQKYGLKRRHLIKFTKPVDRFYEKVITNKDYKSELAIKYQKRFVKYRDSLFTFLQHDGVPWHNNAAERALRHIARQQQVSLVFHEQVTHDYLRLLSIRQTLRFQDKSFFRFLFSGGKDISKVK